MTPTDDAPGGGPSTALLALTSLALLASAYVQLVFILPTFSAMMGSWGAAYSRPSLLLLGIGRLGGVIAALDLGLLGWLYVRGRTGAAERRQFDLALGVTTFLIALYVSLLCWIYIDYAIAVPHSHAVALASSRIR